MLDFVCDDSRIWDSDMSFSTEDHSNPKSVEGCEQAESQYEEKHDEEVCHPLYVVGIGASAGGLEALELLFERMPVDTGLAFVVVQHLSPDFQSHMDELLGRKTRIPIHRVEDGMQVEPDSIYLIPPKKDMIISQGRLLLTDKEPERGLTMPIDSFLRSLAQDVGRHSIAVILSGTGSDGSRGVTYVHDAGGLVVVQEEDTAKFDGMPRAAIESGVTDLILPPQAIPAALKKFAHEAISPEALANEEIPSTSDQGMEQIFRLLRTGYGIDFTHYKPSTVMRRTERRTSLTKSANVKDYAQFVAENPQELDALYRDLLIGVTQFFRDPDSFRRLETDVVAPILSKVDRQQEIRVWVPGCATGEEAYSLAILFHEQLEAANRPMNVKIFATDMHRDSLEFASEGIYSEDQLENIPATRRRRYFVRKSDGYHVIPVLRQMIVFAPQNVITDAPFTKMHLVSCRNLLIYFQPVAQKKVVSLFHFGLKMGGFLFLGPSESPGELQDEFDIIDNHWKIYRKRRDVRLPVSMGMALTPSPGLRQRELSTMKRGHQDGSLLEHYDAILARKMPAAILVDEEYQLLHTFGGAERFLHLKGGRSPLNVLEMFDDELKTAVTGGLQHARKENAPVRYTGIHVTVGESTQDLKLVVEPILLGPDKPGSFLITFEALQESTRTEIAAAGDPTEYNVSEMARDQIGALQNELRFTKENLQATIEELETSNEELQATNEEMVASNEELQSTNEELQSVNEELYTVNAEHQRKNTELTEMTDDMHSLLESTDVGVIYLDQEMFIRRFTPRVAESFNLLPQDIGRRIDSFAHTIDEPHLIEDVQCVLESHEGIEKQVHDQAGVPYFLRIFPYRSQSRVMGVVLTLIEITKLLEAEQRRENAEAQFRGTFENAAVGMAHKDSEGKWLRVNDRFCEIVGYTRDELTKKTFRDITHADDLDADIEKFEQLKSGLIQSYQMEKRYIHKNGSEVWVELTASLQFNAKNKPEYCIAIVQDISRRKKFENELQVAIKSRESFLAMLSHELRNPLSAILNATRLLERGVGKETGFSQVDVTSVISRQSQQMAKLLEDLLDVSRVSNGKIELNREPVDLVKLVEAVKETADPTLREHDIIFSTNVPDSPVWVNGDQVRLQQIQVNLLGNAAKYSPPGSRVVLSVNAENDDAIIRVKDEGIGIPSELLDKIFDPFVQSDETLHRSEGGLGVGLTLVSSLVNLHGGSVSAQSEGRGKGSEFIVTLPRLKIVNQKEHANGSSRSPKGEALRIVLIEDQPDNARLLKAHLEMDGHQVSPAFDGQTGLELILKAKPDAVILDIGIPTLNGYEVAKRVREHDEGKKLFIIALTGYGQASDVARAKECGFDAHLVKPLDLAKLRDVLARRRPIAGDGDST